MVAMVVMVVMVMMVARYEAGVVVVVMVVMGGDGFDADVRWIAVIGGLGIPGRSITLLLGAPSRLCGT